MFKIAPLSALFCSLTALQGCGGGPATTDAATDSDAAVVDAGTQSDAATYTRVREQAFNSCSGEGCHYGLQPSLNPWDWKSLVNAQSAGAPGKVRVKPFDPDNSFLFQKITNKQGKNEGTGHASLRDAVGGSDRAGETLDRCGGEERLR